MTYESNCETRGHIAHILRKTSFRYRFGSLCRNFCLSADSKVTQSKAVQICRNSDHIVFELHCMVNSLGNGITQPSFSERHSPLCGKRETIRTGSRFCPFAGHGKDWVLDTLPSFATRRCKGIIARIREFIKNQFLLLSFAKIQYGDHNVAQQQPWRPQLSQILLLTSRCCLTFSLDNGLVANKLVCFSAEIPSLQLESYVECKSFNNDYRVTEMDN